MSSLDKEIQVLIQEDIRTKRIQPEDINNEEYQKDVLKRISENERRKEYVPDPLPEANLPNTLRHYILGAPINLNNNNNIHTYNDALKSLPQLSTSPSFPHNPDEKIRYAFAVATQLINTNKHPSRDNPIILQGQNATPLQYIWTALMVLGKVFERKFDERAILVKSNVFNPKAEMGVGVFEFSKTSLYNREFRTNPTVVDVVNQWREWQEKKSVHQKEVTPVSISPYKASLYDEVPPKIEEADADALNEHLSKP